MCRTVSLRSIKPYASAKFPIFQRSPSSLNVGENRCGWHQRWHQESWRSSRVLLRFYVTCKKGIKRTSAGRFGGHIASIRTRTCQTRSASHGAAAVAVGLWMEKLIGKSLVQEPKQSFGAHVPHAPYSPTPMWCVPSYPPQCERGSLVKRKSQSKPVP